MNEDETTQALSDKIMDRANVLRFGRPKSLQAKGNPIQFGEKCGDRNPTTIKEWEKLQRKSLDAGDAEKLDKDIDNLNNVMESLGRPFAHRVKRSIVNYVTNYPGVGSTVNSFNNALSDQIEFKILPKLNGIEKTNPDNSNHLNDLGNIIGSIDEELYKTFDNVLNDNSSSFFAWSGVRR